MILVLHFVFLSEDNKPWKLLKSLWNPAPSSHYMIFNNLIIHISWNSVHVWFIRWVISSITYFKKWCFLSQFLCDVLSNIVIFYMSLTFLLILIFFNIELILLLLSNILIIIVYLCFHFGSFVNRLGHSLNCQESIAVSHILTFIHIHGSSIGVACSTS